MPQRWSKKRRTTSPNWVEFAARNTPGMHGLFSSQHGCFIRSLDQSGAARRQRNRHNRHQHGNDQTDPDRHRKLPFRDDIPMLIDLCQLRKTSGRGKIIQHDSELRALRDINRKMEIHSSVRRGYCGPTESRNWLEVAAPLKRFKKASGRARLGYSIARGGRLNGLPAPIIQALGTVIDLLRSAEDSSNPACNRMVITHPAKTASRRFLPSNRTTKTVRLGILDYRKFPPNRPSCDRLSRPF